jgi:hypothetical protein
LKSLLPLAILIFFFLTHPFFEELIPLSLSKTHLTSSKSKHQVLSDPELTGPDRLCNVFGSVVGTFSGGGDPATDLYQWTIKGPQGQVLFERPAGIFPSITYTFGLLGTHRVELTVFRGGQLFSEFTKNVELVAGPKIILESNYEICENQEIEIPAIDPSSSNFPSYEFEWRNEAGLLVGTANILKTSVPGNYSVKFLFVNGQGISECETSLNTRVSISTDYTLGSDKVNVCPDETITFFTNPNRSGEWYVQKSGDPTLNPLGSGSSKTLTPNSDLDGPGKYEVIFVVPNENNPSCIKESRKEFSYNPFPEFELISAVGASGCLVPDGLIRIKALTSIDVLSLANENQSFGPLSAGDTVEFKGLLSGAYTLIGSLGGCSNSEGLIVPLINPPSQLEFELTDIQSEFCTPTGKENGSFLVQLKAGVLEGSYRIKTIKGVEIRNEALPLVDEFRIDIPGGKYLFEILDKDSCNLPKSEAFEIPGLDQVSFFVPENLSICGSFELKPQTSQSLEFTLTFPDSSQETIKSGESFTLTQAGKHILLGNLPGQSTLCPAVKEFDVSLVDPVDFEPVLIDQDCFGNLTYKAEIGNIPPNSVVFRWLDDSNQLVGTGQFLNPTSFGKFKLDVQPATSEACPIPPVEFEIKQPVLFVDVSLEATKLCEFGPKAVIKLSATFFEEVTDIEWRKYDSLGTIENLPQFQNKSEIVVDEAGLYEVAVYSRIPSINKNCELGRSSIQVDLVPEKVPFNVPANLSICDPYSLIPQSATPLVFSLTFPDGKVETKNWNEAFILDQAGTYTLLGYDPDPKGALCPEQKSISVLINPPVQFSPVLVTLLCDGTYEYKAEVTNYAPGNVDYFWRNAAGNLLGSNQTFLTASYGSFTLEVQPKGSIPCQIQPVSFDVPVPVLSIEAKILAEPLCPDQPSAALKAEADFTEVASIEWWYTDINNNRSQLTAETGKKEILAFNEGTYELILKNKFNCVLGTDQVLVLRSSDQVRPVLEENYLICPKYEIAPTLNPGSFAQYEWYFESTLVSTSPTFKPLQIGTYNLTVFSQEGCAYQTSFTTEEECELRVSFPNAIQPGSPDKPFLIYTNYLIDELEIWIFSKWGEVIFQCKNTDLITEESTCNWDGYFNGEKIPPGSYAYRINYRNLSKKIEKEQLGSILVIN